MGATKTYLCDECMSQQEWAGILDGLYALADDTEGCEHCGEIRAAQPKLSRAEEREIREEKAYERWRERYYEEKRNG